MKPVLELFLYFLTLSGTVHAGGTYVSSGPGTITAQQLPATAIDYGYRGPQIGRPHYADSGQRIGINDMNYLQKLQSKYGQLGSGSTTNGFTKQARPYMPMQQPFHSKPVVANHGSAISSVIQGTSLQPGQLVQQQTDVKMGPPRTSGTRPGYYIPLQQPHQGKSIATVNGNSGSSGNMGSSVKPGQLMFHKNGHVMPGGILGGGTTTNGGQTTGIGDSGSMQTGGTTTTTGIQSNGAVHLQIKQQNQGQVFTGSGQMRPGMVCCGNKRKPVYNGGIHTGLIGQGHQLTGLGHKTTGGGNIVSNAAGQIRTVQPGSGQNDGTTNILHQGKQAAASPVLIGSGQIANGPKSITTQIQGPNGYVKHGFIGQGQIGAGPEGLGQIGIKPIINGQIGTSQLGQWKFKPGYSAVNQISPGQITRGTNQFIQQVGNGQLGMGQLGTQTSGTGQIGLGQMMPGYVGTESLGPGYLGTGSLGPGYVGTGSLGPGYVGTGSLGSGYVGTGSLGPWRQMGQGQMGLVQARTALVKTSQFEKQNGPHYSGRPNGQLGTRFVGPSQIGIPHGGSGHLGTVNQGSLTNSGQISTMIGQKGLGQLGQGMQGLRPQGLGHQGLGQQGLGQAGLGLQGFRLQALGQQTLGQQGLQQTPPFPVQQIKQGIPAAYQMQPGQLHGYYQPVSSNGYSYGYSQKSFG